MGPTVVGVVGSGVCFRSAAHSTGDGASNSSVALSSSRKKCQQNDIIKSVTTPGVQRCIPSSSEYEYGPFMTEISMKSLINMFYLFSPF